LKVSQTEYNVYKDHLALDISENFLSVSALFYNYSICMYV